jgi:hypothetical protein
LKIGSFEIKITWFKSQSIFDSFRKKKRIKAVKTSHCFLKFRTTKIAGVRCGRVEESAMCLVTLPGASRLRQGTVYPQMRISLKFSMGSNWCWGTLCSQIVPGVDSGIAQGLW